MEKQWEKDEKLVSIEWERANGKKISLHPPYSSNQLQTFRFLQTKKWLKTPIDFHIVPRGPQCIVFTTQNTLQEKRSYELYFWERLNGDFQSGRYEDQVFVLPQTWIDALFQITHKSYWDKMSSVWNSKNL